MKKKKQSRKKSNAQGKGKTKEKLRTSIDVYNQLRWDERFDASRFFFGYEERYAGTKEIRVSEFVANGEIPWHRIWYVRDDSRVVWDRKTRVDMLLGDKVEKLICTRESTETTESITLPSEPIPTQETLPETTHEKKRKGPMFSPLRVYGYDRELGEWQETESILPKIKQSTKEKSHKTLRVATYNVLFDTYDKKRVRSEVRLPAVFEHLQSCKADIIALQEVTPTFLPQLLEQEWVKEQYYVSDSVGCVSVRPYGQILLSRYPIRKLSMHRFSESKRVIFAEVAFAGQKIIVAVVHLSSSRNKDAEQIRELQLKRLLQYTSETTVDEPDTPWLIVGDFNERGQTHDELLMEHGFVELWPELHPNSPGYTFEPGRNALAAAQSLTGKPGRLDRIYFRAHGDNLSPRQARLFGTQAIPDTDGLFPSDHFGLCATFLCQTRKKQVMTLPDQCGKDSAEQSPQWPEDIQEALCAKPVYRSALVVMPPESSWEEIQTIRQKHDKSFTRWMPHINLVYGFLPEKHFEAAAKVLQAELAKIPAFEVTLESFAQFSHRASNTVFLQPDFGSQGVLKSFQARLEGLFPHCDEQGRKSDKGFTPHLTVAQFKKGEAEDKERMIKRWNRAWRPKTFPVKEIFLISRRDDQPFEIRHAIPLLGSCDGDKPLSPERLTSPKDSGPDFSTQERLLEEILQNNGGYDSAERLALRKRVFQELERHCEEFLLENDFDFDCPVLYKVGSARLGVLLPQSDLDLVCILPAALSKQSLFAYVLEKLSEQGGLSYHRVLKDALVPVLKMRVHGLDVDVMLSHYPKEIELCHPKDLHHSLRETFEPYDWQVLNSILEAEEILRVVQDHDALPFFRKVLRVVKLWAQRRGLDSNALGFLGGFSWATLCAWKIRELGKSSGATSVFLQELFTSLVEWNWKAPIGLASYKGVRLLSKRDRMPIMTACLPFQNSARNVTSSTFEVLVAEWKEAAAQMSPDGGVEVDWKSFLLPVTAASRVSIQPKVRSLMTVMELQCSHEENVSSCVGRLEGNILSLILELEALGAHVQVLSPRYTECGDEQAEGTSSFSVYYEVCLDFPFRLKLQDADELDDRVKACIERFVDGQRAWYSENVEGQVSLEFAFHASR